MPKFTIDAPEGASPAAKHAMFAAVSEALRAAYGISDVRGWLHEYAPGNASQDGYVGAEPIRPVCSLDAPELADLASKRVMVHRIRAAIAAAYQGLADTREIVVLIRQYEAKNAGINQVF